MADVTYNEQRERMLNREAPYLKAVARRSKASHEISDRLVDVIRLASQGMTDKFIAAEIGLAPRGVAWRWKEIFLRLDARNRTHAVAIALRTGLFR